MKRLGLLAVGAWASFLVAGACTTNNTTVVQQISEEGGAGEGGVPAHLDEVRAAIKPLADAECKWIFQCCNADERAGELGPGPTAADCADRVLQAESTTLYTLYYLPLSDSTIQVLNEIGRLSYGTAYDHVTIDAAAVQACAQSIGSRACSKPAPKDHCVPQAPVDDPCVGRKLIVGKQPLGGSCDDSLDCAPGLFCRNTTGSGGRCLKTGQVGDTCFADAECGDAICDFVTGKCVKGAAYGEACSFADPAHPQQGTEKVRCASNLACDTVTLKCSDAGCAGGSNCSVDANCPAGTVCVTNRCGTPGKPGARCFRDTDCESDHCVYDPIANGQVCAVAFPDGTACNQDQDCASHFCVFGLNGGSCTALQPMGMGSPCTTNQQCMSQVCANNKCAEKGESGAACGSPTLPPCDDALYCAPADDASEGGAPGADASAAGTCKAKKPEGAPCTLDIECWGGCMPSHGQLRCGGTGPGQAHCGG
jgi:hypothetical protein